MWCIAVAGYQILWALISFSSSAPAHVCRMDRCSASAPVGAWACLGGHGLAEHPSGSLLAFWVLIFPCFSFFVLVVGVCASSALHCILQGSCVPRGSQDGSSPGRRY